jgi:hypothetical protein
MRIDPDACRDPDLLAAEVRRLRAVIESVKPVLTDAEREAMGVAAEYYSDKAADAYVYAENDEYYSRIAATLRGLLERTT